MLLAAVVLFVVAGLLGVAARPTLSWLLQIAASVLLTVVGALGLSGSGHTLALDGTSGLGAANLRVDRLSGLFLVICFGVAVPILLAATTSRTPVRPHLPSAVALTLGGVLLVVTADHLFVLIFGWELVTFAFYLLSGYDRRAAGRARASVAAVGFGKVSGSLLLVGGLLLAARAHSFLLANLGAAPHDAAWAAGYALLLLGFATKIGLVPLQVWLPPAYAAAPGPARAIMAGVAVNIGFYGMWRALQVLGPAPDWLATAVLVIGGVTAILGIAHAAVNPDLAQLVAWSSVENAGVITAGFGVALAGSAAHEPKLQAAGLLAATAQVIAHTLGKSLLFTATAAIETATGSTDLDVLRGITKRLPWSGAALVVGGLTLAGLPLTAGFASEWLTLESLMQQFRISQLSVQLASAAAGALVALTVGVAGVTFVRLIALTAFGSPAVRPRSTGADRAIGHRCAVALLALGCLGVAAIAPLEVRMIAAGLQPVAGTRTSGALAQPWVVQPVYAGFSALSPSWLWIAIPVMTLAVGIAVVLFSGNRLWKVRRVPAWSSASPGVDRGVGYTSFGYANPMRKVLANLLLTRAQLRAAEHAGQIDADEDELSAFGAAPPTFHYRVDIVEVVGRYLYRPLAVALLTLVRLVKRLQSGRLDAYLAYMLIALVAVLAVVTAVG